MELGTYDIRLTPEGQSDELFGELPQVFRAQLGRKDRAEKLPAGVINLAKSASCPSQAYRIRQKPIWATQFHPEMTGEENRARYLRYMDMYSELLDENERSQALSRFGDSPHTPHLIPRFLDLISP